MTGKRILTLSITRTGRFRAAITPNFRGMSEWELIARLERVQMIVSRARSEREELKATLPTEPEKEYPRGYHAALDAVSEAIK